MTYTQTFVISALILTQAGCSALHGECNLMYAPSTLIINLEGAPTLLGTWALDLEMTSLEGADRGDETSHVTLTREALGTQTVISSAPTDPLFQLEIDEEVSTGEVKALILQEIAPETIWVTLSEDEHIFADGTFTPNYEVSEPNGEGCGERYSGSITLPTDL